MKKTVLSITAGMTAIFVSAIYFYGFTEWTPVLYFLSIGLYVISAGCLAARFSEKKPLLRGATAGLAFGAGFFGLNLLVNNVLLHATQAKLAAEIVCATTLVLFIAYYCVLSRKKRKTECWRQSCLRSVSR